MLQIQNNLSHMHPLIAAGFLTALIVCAAALVEEQLRRIPRVCRWSGEAWPTHRGKAHQAAKRRASDRRRRLHARRAAARGHRPAEQTLAPVITMPHRSAGLPPLAGPVREGGGGGACRGDGATTPRLFYRGYRIDLADIESPVPDMMWVHFVGLRADALVLVATDGIEVRS